MRTTTLAVFALGAALLGCSGLLPPRQATQEQLSLEIVPDGPCGGFVARATSTLDLDAPVEIYEEESGLAASAAGPQVEQPMRSTAERVFWARHGRWETARVTAGGLPWDLEVSRSPQGVLPVNDLPTLRLQVRGECLATHQLRLKGELEGQPVLDVGLLADGRAELTLPPLGEGRHSLSIWFEEDERAVKQLDWFVDVGPPCPDLDGDGAPCLSDCDDGDPAVHPGATDVRGNGVDDDCDGVNGLDRDADGHEDAEVGGDDCDDGDAAVHPGAPEGRDADGDGFVLPDRVDNDCDGAVDEDLLADCDDGDAAVNPGRVEAASPNGIDDNCDGRVDEGTVAFDDDGDGLSEQEGDCDDADAAVFPGAAERPDCRDDDCDGEVDEGVERVARDDGFESNDTLDQAANLGHEGERRFRQHLSLVTRGEGDGEWFRFHSHDGFWDDWALVAIVDPLPEGSSYRVGFYDEAGDRVVVSVLGPEGGRVVFEGVGNSNDSGVYLLGVEPVTAPRAWCPVSLDLKSR